MSTSTSLAAMLANQAPPLPAKPTYTVEIRYWRPRRRPDIFDVVMPCGLILYGCYVYVVHSQRRVKAVGHEFDTPEDRDRFCEAVLAALDGEVRR